MVNPEGEGREEKGRKEKIKEGIGGVRGARGLGGDRCTNPEQTTSSHFYQWEFDFSQFCVPWR
jgi:hypothetical protein